MCFFLISNRLRGQIHELKLGWPHIKSAANYCNPSLFAHRTRKQQISNEPKDASLAHSLSLALRPWLVDASKYLSLHLKEALIVHYLGIIKNGINRSSCQHHCLNNVTYFSEFPN